MHRRAFLSTATAAAVISNARPADGSDRPVRNQPLRASYWGSQYYDDKEREQLMDVVNNQSPFRWYGKVQPLKVLTFELRICAANGDAIRPGGHLRHRSPAVCRQRPRNRFRR